MLSFGVAVLGLQERHLICISFVKQYLALRDADNDAVSQQCD